MDSSLAKIETVRQRRPISSVAIPRQNNFSNLDRECEKSVQGDESFKGRIDDYIIGKEIGKGAYAIVKQAIHKPSSTKVAIKIYEKFRLTDNIRKSAAKREIQILKMLNHPNTIKLYEVIDLPKQVTLN